MKADPERKIAIIGAGVAGLATARALVSEGIACTVFDRADKLGGVWAYGRYPCDNLLF